MDANECLSDESFFYVFFPFCLLKEFLKFSRTAG